MVVEHRQLKLVTFSAFRTANPTYGFPPETQLLGSQATYLFPPSIRHEIQSVVAY